MQLKDIYTPEVICCSKDTDAVAAAVLMRQRHVGALVLVDDVDGDRIPVGVITDRDLVVEVMAEGLEARTTRVGSLTRKPVIIAQESEETGVVIERMRTHGIRRVPIVDHTGALVGIVTLDDLLVLVVDEANALVQTNRRGQKEERQQRR
jgi:CBS domain-containing protein